MDPSKRKTGFRYDNNPALQDKQTMGKQQINNVINTFLHFRLTLLLVSVIVLLFAALFYSWRFPPAGMHGGNVNLDTLADILSSQQDFLRKLSALERQIKKMEEMNLEINYNLTTLNTLITDSVKKFEETREEYRYTQQKAEKEQKNILKQQKNMATQFKNIKRGRGASLHKIKQSLIAEIVEKANVIEKIKSSFDETVSQIETEFKNEIQALGAEKTTFQKEIDNFQHTKQNITSDLDNFSKTIKNNTFYFTKFVRENKQTVGRILENTFNKVTLIIAIILLYILYPILAASVYRLSKQSHRNSNTTSSDGDVSNEMAIGNIPKRLLNAICVISFHEDTQVHHRQLVSTITECFKDDWISEFKVLYHLIRRHEDIQSIPSARLHFMCVNFSERNVIIEQPGLGLGDMKKSTYEKVRSFHGGLVIIYVRDPYSRGLSPHKRYNTDLDCVKSQQELKVLNDIGRFFSVFQTFTDFQLQCLRNIVSETFEKIY